MKEINGIEKVERALGRWHPGDLACIESFELNRDSQLKMIALFQRQSDAWPNFDEAMLRVNITFDDVGELHLKGFTGGMVQIMGFDILFVGDRGLEGIKYEIEDYEENKLGFYCGEICIVDANFD